jgi:hypothetical protein
VNPSAYERFIYLLLDIGQRAVARQFRGGLGRMAAQSLATAGVIAGVVTALLLPMTLLYGAANGTHRQRQRAAVNPDIGIRHAVSRPAGMNASTLESGYWRAYKDCRGGRAARLRSFTPIRGIL